MNERNVEALTHALGDMIVPFIDPDRVLPEMTPRMIAEMLSEQGVLIPSALTDEESRAVLEAGKTCVQQDDPLYHEGDMRLSLERIAQGLQEREP